MQIQAEKAAKANPPKPSTNYLDPATNKFDLETLKSSFPEGVEPSKKEMYLEPAVFESTFGMDFAKWETLKDWKRVDLKKAKGLF